MLNQLPEVKEPCLYIVGGIHGAGKSTLLNELALSTQFPVVAAESLKMESRKSGTRQLRELRNQAFEKIELQKSFLFEHVMSGNFVPKLLSKASQHQFSTILIYLFCDWETAQHRALARQIKLKTNGPEKLAASKEQFWNQYRSQANHWLLIDNCAEEYQVVAAGIGDDTVRVSKPDLLAKFLRDL